MHYGGTFKAKSQLSNYINKQKNKQKTNSNSTSNNTIISKDDTNQLLVDSFRKGTIGDHRKTITKFKTGKNSPDHYILNQNNSSNLRSLSGKHKTLNEEQSMEIKSILSTSKIKKMLKDKIGFDSMFKKKMQMIQNNEKKHEKNQMTYSNIYNHNLTKNKVVDSYFYQKGSKNESFVKKKGDAFEEENCVMSNSNQIINSKTKNNIYEQDINCKCKSNNNSNNNHNGNQHQEELKFIHENVNHNFGMSNYIDIYFGNGYNNNILYKSNHLSKQSSCYLNSNNNTKKHNSLISNSNSILENNYVNSNKHSNRDLLGETKMKPKPKPKPKTSNKDFSSKNNIRKKSIDKISQVYCQNGNNLSSSTLKMFNYQKEVKEKSSNLANIDTGNRSSSSSLSFMQKYYRESKAKNKSDCINSSNNNNANQGNKNEGKITLINVANTINPSPRITSTRLPSSLQVFNNNKENVVQSSTTKNLSGIKFSEYVLSDHKSNNNSTKNNSLKKGVEEKNKDKEKEIFLAKFNANQKKNKSLTTVQSKLNSQSNSRVEEYFNIPFANKQKDDDVFNFGIANKGDKLIKKNSSSNKKLPITMCQSPIGKTANEILKKINVKKSPQLEIQSETTKKISSKNGLETVKKSLESIDQLINNNPKPHANGVEIEQMLNETCESIQSTTREGAFYKKESDKISNYIREYYTINKAYPPTKIQFYRCGRLIGRGAFGKVNLALHVCSGRLVAIKSFNKSKNTSKHSMNKIKNEIVMLKQLKHPFISQILDTFETEKHTVIVMEYICGDLFSFIRKRSKLSEAFSKIIFKQIIEGLKYIHRNQIVHRDIKLDKILIDLDNTVKICDFGVSRTVTPGTIMHDHCGTPAYIAPEIFLKKGYQGFACDIWSSGVTLYYMLSGTQPFKANNLPDLHSVIISGQYEKLETISTEARDLIDGMLQVDPKKRMTISQILSHPWLSSIDTKNRSNLNLFTTAEKVLLAKHDIDYLTSNKENIIEQFTLKNLDTLKEEELMNGNTKSLILAPFNSVVNLNDSSFCSDIPIDNNIWKFCGKVKQLNIKYELNNNKLFDNGIIITQPDQNEKNDKANNNMTSSSRKYSSSKPMSPHVELEEPEDYLSIPGQKDNVCKIEEEVLLNEEEIINDNIIKHIEKSIGYKQSYVISCLEKKEVNYATACYYLHNKSK